MNCEGCNTILTRATVQAPGSRWCIECAPNNTTDLNEPVCLQDVSVGAIERMHGIAHKMGWGEIKFDTREAMTQRQINGERWRAL